MTLQSQPTKPIALSQHNAATVVGLGATGYSAVRYLRARGLDVTVVDSRTSPPLLSKLNEFYPEVTLRAGSFEDQNLDSEHLIVVSPGVALNEPVLRKVKKEGAQIVGDIELFLQENQAPVIAITGSNGKSTVTTLVGEMCQSADMQPLVAGNIGLPALDAFTDAVVYDIAVLELSSFQLETTSQVPADVAAILNVSADHMDRYDSMGDYLLAKARVLRGAKRAVLPRHDEQLKQITNASQSVSFDLDEPSSDAEFGVTRHSNRRWLTKGSERLIELRKIPLLGLHNVKNVLAAFALLDHLDLPRQALVDAVTRFKGLPHRMQTVLENNDVAWVNDSKATNVGATATALRNLEKDVVWIAGGQGKDADFTQLRNAIGSNITLLILFGEDAIQIEQALEGLLPIQKVADMEAAVLLAHQSAKQDSIVLLSPACASFDMYQNFEQRGEDFVNHARALAERGTA